MIVLHRGPVRPDNIASVPTVGDEFSGDAGTARLVMTISRPTARLRQILAPLRLSKKQAALRFLARRSATPNVHVKSYRRGLVIEKHDRSPPISLAA